MNKMAADATDAVIFKQHKRFLEDNIDPDFGLLDKLQSSETLTPREISNIKACKTFYERNELLLDCISKQDKFNSLLGALRDANQVHLVNYVISNGEYNAEEFGNEWPLRKEELSILTKNQEALVDLIEPGELIGRLYSRGVINKRQRNAISSKLTCEEKNEALLEIMKRRSLKDYKVTIQCLRESNQDHIAQILEQGGVVVKVHAEGLGDKTEDEIINVIRELLANKTPEERQRILEGIAPDVIGGKKGESVVLYFYCKTVSQVIQLKEMQIKGTLRTAVQRLFVKLLTTIQSIEVTLENPPILDLQHRRSQFDEMAVTLSEQEYKRSRSYFPANIKLRALSDFDPKEMSEQQSIELKDILQRSAESKDASEEHLNPYKMALSLKKGDLMETFLPEDIGDAITWWRVKHLKSGEIGYVPRRLVIIDYQMQYENSTATSQTDILKSAKSEISISNLPLELLDYILQKSYHQHVLREEQVMRNKDYDAISQLASVDCCWFERIRKRKFKKELWRSLVAFYKRKAKMSSIYKINRQYLEENIQLKGLVNRLKCKDCLTDVQTASLYRQNLPLGKKNSFNGFRDPKLEMVKKKEATDSVFRRCLCDTKQHLIAEVIENGGAMMKVEIKLQKSETLVKRRHQNLQIVERINELRDKTKARSHQIEKLADKLMQEDLKIFSSSQDVDTTVFWICCKTKHSFEKLQTRKESIVVFTELAKNLLISAGERNPAMIKPKVNIDFEQFEKTVVCFSIVAKFTSRLNFRTKEHEEEKEEYVQGVTKLRNKIHVLLKCSSSAPPVILVFEDEIPFRLQKRIEIKEIKDPRDIASNEMENSLYVLDLYTKCVWKIKEEGDEEEKEEKIIRWLELGDYNTLDGPGTLSVTRDGQLLLVGQRKDDQFFSLRIFGGSEEGDLRLSIPLPEDIQKPIHALETSKGNFIICHWKMEMEEWMKVVSEVSGDGKMILRRFIPKNEEQKLSRSFSYFGHLAVDSFGRVFLTDCGKERVILFDSDLQWNGILIPTEEDGKEGRKILEPKRLFYDEEKKELIVGGWKEVFVYTLNRK